MGVPSGGPWQPQLRPWGVSMNPAMATAWGPPWAPAGNVLFRTWVREVHAYFDVHEGRAALSQQAAQRFSEASKGKRENSRCEYRRRLLVIGQKLKGSRGPRDLPAVLLG